MSTSKTLVKARQIITDGVMTGTSVITSSEQDCSGAKLISIELSWSGTPNGTFVVQRPATYNANGTVATWATLPVTSTNGDTLTAAGSASTHQIDVTVVCFTRVRVQYTNASSTGTLQAWVTVKGE